MAEYTDSNKLHFMKLRENACVPVRATVGSAGYDLCACTEEPVAIAPGQRVLLPTGLAVQLPTGTAGMIFSRSGLGNRHGIHVTNGVGVIDWDYRGEFYVGLHNLGDESYTIEPGERIAQLIVIPVLTPETELVEALDETHRGTGGFGSTGRA